MRVGLPLLLALWQVYEIYATEAVGQPALSAHLLGEQRICMRALVSSAADADAVRGPAEFAAFMRLHGKRYAQWGEKSIGRPLVGRPSSHGRWAHNWPTTGARRGAHDGRLAGSR